MCLHVRRIRNGSAHNRRGRHTQTPRAQGYIQPSQRIPFRLLSRLCVMPARVYARFIGRSAQFQNLSSRNVAQIFLYFFRADPPEPLSAEKLFASKERDKTACHALGGIWGRRKNAGCIVFLPKGGGATHRRTARHSEALQGQLASGGNADRTQKAGDSSVYIRFAGGGTLVIVDRRLLARTGASPDGQAGVTLKQVNRREFWQDVERGGKG